MEEVRWLRVQQRTKRLKVFDNDNTEENEMPDITSTIPFLSRMTATTLRQLYLTSFAILSGIIVFGGLLAPFLQAVDMLPKKAVDALKVISDLPGILTGLTKEFNIDKFLGKECNK